MDADTVIKVLGVDIEVNLVVPEEAMGLVIFAHGGGDGVENLRDAKLAKELNSQGMSTLVFDLLTEQEEKNIKNRFDIDLLTDRLVGVTKWCMDNERLVGLPIGYLGTDTGAAAALSAAAYWGGSKIKAVVSRGGRPDLANEVLDLVESPTLLIVGSNDKETIDNNRQAYIHLGCEKKTEIILGSTGSFDGEGAIEKVAELASRWFIRNFEKV